MRIMLTPEGAAGYMPRWRTGFYHVARNARVPIAMGYVDYKHKSIGIDTYFQPSNSIEFDMQYIKDYYSQKKPKNIDKAGPIGIGF